MAVDLPPGLLPSQNLADLQNPSLARSNLGLGSVAVNNVGTGFVVSGGAVSVAYGSSANTAARGDLAEFVANKNQPGGYLGLGSDGKIPSAYLPASIVGGALLASNNLSDLTNPANARANLSLGTLSTQGSDNVSVSGGALDNVVIGGNSPNVGHFTNLTASNPPINDNSTNVATTAWVRSAVGNTFNPSSVAISGGSIDNTTVGASIAGVGHFTTLTATTPAGSDNSTNVATTAWVAGFVSSAGTYTPNNVAITGGTINGTSIGGTTPSSGTFTALAASTLTLSGTTTNNFFLAGAASGPASPATFRAITAGDLPVATTGALGVARVGTGLGVTSGTISVSYGTTSSSAAVGNDTRITGALQASNNLGDLVSQATARTNLGLGSMATQASSSISVSGGSINGTTIGNISAATGTFTSLTASGTVSLGTSGSNGNSVLFQGALVDQSSISQTVANGFSVAIPNNCTSFMIGAASNLATGTITLPASPVNKQFVIVSSSVQITSLTVNTNAGQTLLSAPTAILAGSALWFIYNSANTTWYNVTPRSAIAALLGGTIDNTVIGGNTPAAATFTTLALTSSQSASSFLAAPSGSAGAPSFRTITGADLPLATTLAAGVVSVSTGLGVSAGALSVSYGTTAGTSAQGNDSRISGALQASNNLTDLTSMNTARANLGLGSMATQNAGAVTVTGGTVNGTTIGATTPTTATFTTATIGSQAATGATLFLNSGANYAKQVVAQTGSVNRWAFGVDNTAESFLSLNTSSQTASGTVLNFSSTSGVAVGMLVRGTNIPANASVASLTTNTVTLSAAVSGTVPTSSTIQFEADSGSNFVLTAYDDYGNSLGNIVSVSRATGGVTLGNPGGTLGSVAAPLRLSFPADYAASGNGLKVDLYSGTYGLGMTSGNLNVVSAGTVTFTNSAATIIPNVTVSAGSLNGVTIGATTAGTGRFTTLTANTPSANDNSTNVATTAFVANAMSSAGTFNAANVAITGGTINGTTIGATTPAAATHTTLALTSAIAANTLLIGPASGTAAAPTWRVLAATDLPVATTSLVGGVSAGTGLSVSGSGVLTVNYGTTAGTAAQGNDTRLANALQASNNLSDVASAATSRTNLGLGSIATQGAGGVAITGGTINGTSVGATTPGTGAFTALSATGATSLASVTATTPAVGDSSNSVATTSYVQNAAFGLVSISTSGGTTTLTAAQYGVATLVVIGTLTSNATLVVPNTGLWTVVNRTSGAFTLTVKTASGTGVAIDQGYSMGVLADGTNTAAEHTDFNTIALQGVCTAPTAAPGTNNTQIATTAFVAAAISATSAYNSTNVAITGGTINGTSIGATTASTGAFTTLSASGAVSGAGFTSLLSPYALLASPTFTGTPAAPTAAVGTNSTQVATTAFVATALGGVSPITSTGGSTTLTAAQYGSVNLLVTGTLTSNATLVVPNTGAWTVFNRTSGAFTLTVKTSAGTGVVIDQGYSIGVVADGTNVVLNQTDYNAITLQGVCTAPTATANTNTTQLATTAFVIGQAGTASPVMDGTAAAGTSLLYARQDHVHPTDTSRASLASPTFTGTPAAPTATANTNTTQLATTAFVIGQAGTSTPVMNGSAATGSSFLYARQDHVHPTDTSRAPTVSPTFTGTVTIPTPSAGDSSTAAASTAFVTTFVGGNNTVSTTGGSTTLTAAQYGVGVIVATGTLTSNATFVVPTTGRWIVYNNTTGSFTLTVKTASGSGVIVSQGGRNQVYADGTNVQYAVNASSGLLIQWMGGATVSNGTYYFSTPTPWAGTIGSMDWYCGTGSFIANVQIAATPSATATSVTGLSAVSVSGTTQTNTAATAANTFAAGTTIQVTISSATGSPTNAVLNLRVTKA